jgi:hypothetical protein
MRRTMLWRMTAALALCSLPPEVSGQTPPKTPAPAAEPERRKFVRPAVPVARFTPEKTALLEPECERIASFLARHAAENLTAGVLAGNAAAQTKGRLLLAVSLHLQPMNAGAVHCGLRWSDGKAPSLPPPADDLRIFSNFLLSAAQRQSGKPGPAPETLARILVRLAADLDPENEDAVYASEIQDRDGKAPPLRELLEGTLGKDW